MKSTEIAIDVYCRVGSTRGRKPQCVNWIYVTPHCASGEWSVSIAQKTQPVSCQCRQFVRASYNTTEIKLSIMTRGVHLTPGGSSSPSWSDPVTVHLTHGSGHYCVWAFLASSTGRLIMWWKRASILSEADTEKNGAGSECFDFVFTRSASRCPSVAPS